MEFISWTIVLMAATFCSVASAKRARILASPDIPITSFSCSGRPIGYYADVENDCQTYHMCDEKGQTYSYSCPNTTLFHQRMLICAHWYQVNCSKSEEYYSANLLIGQKDKPFVEDAFRDGLNNIPTSEYIQKLEAAARKENKHLFVGSTVAPPNRNHWQGVHKTVEPPKDRRQQFSGFQQLGISTARPQFAREHHFPHFQSVAQAVSTSVTEKFGDAFKSTNIVFRSTIDTPSNVDATLARTQPMLSAHPVSQTESVFPSSHVDVTTEVPQPPSFELLPPAIDSPPAGDFNTLELHLQDARRALYIPQNGDLPQDEPIIVSINLNRKSRFRPQSQTVNAASNCPKCHPSFIVDRIQCTPCLPTS